MQKNSSIFFIACSALSALLWFGLSVKEAGAQPEVAVKVAMLEVYQAFKELQPYLQDEEEFVKADSRKTVDRLLETLSQKFHQVKDFDTKYQKAPGFGESVRLVNDMLRDSWQRLREGKSAYSFWRVRTLNRHCMTCHASYGVEINFVDPMQDLHKLSNFEKGEFHLATRQYADAQREFLQAALDDKSRVSNMQALRNWLIIYTRINNSPQQAIKDLESTLAKAKLSRDEQEEAKEWLTSLKTWATQIGSGEKQPAELQTAQNLLKSGLNAGDPFAVQVGTVEVLRASTILHQILNKTPIEAASKSQALYLLGFAYSRLPNFFYIDELPDFFLEQAIEEFPGSSDAKKSFRLLKEITVSGFTGSSGEHVPEEVKLRLQELHDKAYGVVQVDGRI